MGIDPATLRNVTLAEDAAAFAAAMRRLTKAPDARERPDSGSDTRRLYDNLFAVGAYRQRLAGLVEPLLTSGAETQVEAKVAIGAEARRA